MNSPYQLFLWACIIRKMHQTKYTDQWIITNKYLSNPHLGKEAMFKNNLSIFFPIHPCLLPNEGFEDSCCFPTYLFFLPYCKEITFGFFISKWDTYLEKCILSEVSGIYSWGHPFSTFSCILFDLGCFWQSLICSVILSTIEIHISVLF